MQSSASLASIRANNSTPAVPSLDGRLRGFKLLFALVAFLWLAGEVAARHGIGASPTWFTAISMRDDGCAMTCLASSFFFFLCARPRRRELVVLLAVALLLTGALRLLTAGLPPEVPLLLDVGCGIGLASLLLLGWRAWVSTGEDRIRILALLLPAILVVLFIPLTKDFHRIGIQLNPDPVDDLLYAADDSLGVQLSFEVGRLFEAVPLLDRLSNFVYSTLPLPFVVVLIMQWRSQRPSNGNIFWDFQILAVLGFVVYMLFPAVGPGVVFPDVFPHAPPSAAEVLGEWGTNPGKWGGDWSDVARNCVPSLHTAWALMLWWHAQSLAGWVRGLTGYYLAFTVLATLGSGAHYAFDLILAVPFALVVRAIGRPSLPGTSRVRWGACLVGTGLTTGLLLLIRFGLPVLAWSADLTRVASLGIVALCLLWERKLDALYQDPLAEAERVPADGGSIPRSQARLQTLPLTVE